MIYYLNSKSSLNYNGNETSWTLHINSDEQLRIPFLLEAEYPGFKFINLLARIKYSYTPNKEGFYSAGLGVALKFK